MSDQEKRNSPAADVAHGHTTFHQKLDALKAGLVTLSQMAEALLARSLDTLRTGDVAAAERVITDDQAIDRLEMQLEADAIALLALQQPMARDLRFIISAIKVTSDLERVGDHAVNIASSMLRMRRLDRQLPLPPIIEEMGRSSRSMLNDALDALVRMDGAAGRAVCRRDDAVDALHDALFRSLLTHMMEQPRMISPALELLLIGRNLERVADLATNVAEDAVYLAEGVSIKHHSAT
ncbi:MAG: phosphate signaling complex protein PhoU [Gemmatimonadetes bacterium]|nr:phosphate signaling complex protein PhoU [Gemmatimonadota bacterium]